MTECNTFTKLYLCFLGQYDWDAVPAIPPEIMTFPDLVLVQHLRNLVMVAGHSGSALDLLCQETAEETAGGDVH